MTGEESIGNPDLVQEEQAKSEADPSGRGAELSA
jgi:hypothetical protein